MDVPVSGMEVGGDGDLEGDGGGLEEVLMELNKFEKRVTETADRDINPVLERYLVRRELPFCYY